MSTTKSEALFFTPQ